MNDELDRNTLEQLRGAARTVTAPPELAVKIRARMEDSAPRPAWLLNWRPLAGLAGIVLMLGGFTSYQLGHLRLTDAAQESYIASISERVPAIMTVGLGDHVHCAVYRNAGQRAIPAAELSREVGERFRGLGELVREQVPAGFKIVGAHRCKYKGRVFVHVTLREGSKLMSLAIAAKSGGESFGDMRAVLANSGIPIYQAGARRFEVAAFETREFLAYVVSDFDRDGNARVTAAIAPAVAAFLDGTHS